MESNCDCALQREWREYLSFPEQQSSRALHLELRCRSEPSDEHDLQFRLSGFPGAPAESGSLARKPSDASVAPLLEAIGRVAGLSGVADASDTLEAKLLRNFRRFRFSLVGTYAERLVRELRRKRA